MHCMTYRIWHATNCFASNGNHSQAKRGRGFGEQHVYLHKRRMHALKYRQFCSQCFCSTTHTIKVPIKGHYGFSTSSNHRESRSTAPALRARRCLLCCHPKELRLVHKPYDHNYWSKWKCHNNINSEDAIKKKSLSHSGKRGPSGTIRGKCLCYVYPVEERVLKWSSYWSHDS